MNSKHNPSGFPLKSGNQFLISAAPPSENWQGGWERMAPQKDELSNDEITTMVAQLRAIAQDSDDGDQLEEIADALECDVDSNPYRDSDSNARHPMQSHQDEATLQGHQTSILWNGCHDIGRHLTPAQRDKYENMFTEIMTGIGAAAEMADKEAKDLAAKS